MRRLIMNRERCINGIDWIERKEDMAVFHVAAQGAEILLPEFVESEERYLTFHAGNRENHSIVLELRFYAFEGNEEPRFYIRFGILPGVKTAVCIDREWLNGNVLFPEPEAGQLKLVCHGKRMENEEIDHVVLAVMPSFHNLTMELSDLVLQEEYLSLTVDEVRLVDMFGQNKTKDWMGKTRGIHELREALEKQEEESKRADCYPEGWSAFGGWKRKKIREGTGFFTKYRVDGRWSLADPDGYAFFSVGPDCVGVGTDCRVDGVERWLDWLPEQTDAQYRTMFQKMENGNGGKAHRQGLLFSYGQANLYRAWGKEWYPRWADMITGQLCRYGMNTLGNWSDSRLLGKNGMPYVTSLPEFPKTRQMIFRDFPDVLSDEYVQDARRCAEALKEKKDDPLMIGYFLRNEPNWAFAEPLVLADEVLFQPARTVCKEELIRFLTEKYQTIGQLNQAYHCELKDFEELYHPQKDVSCWSEASRRDMREFSRKLLRAYVEIPCRECRKVDENHMILGMRWAWISDPDLVTGWENFDVFSINCYAQDPTKNIEQVIRLGVDLPVLIGEFHFGALDAGPVSTGLEGVVSQRDRGVAYRYYCERVAAHPNGVGCHYFQCYDQFVLGRFDGENYNIGLFDICSRPYREMLEEVWQCSCEIYDVKFGIRKASEERAQSVPMIAF